MGRAVVILSFVVGALGLAACGGDDEPAAAPSTTEGPAATTVPAASTSAAPETTAAPSTSSVTTAPTTEVPTTTISETTLAPEPADPWVGFELDGCECSDGSDMTFFEHAGDPTKVVLYFEGGGACFSAATCDPAATNRPYTAQATVTAEELAARNGYFDFANPDNPIGEYSMIYVPYCTGDVHMGNATTDYGDGVVIEHVGHTNAVAALEYLVEQYPSTQQLVVTGASAGSVPTPLMAALAADQLPAAEIVTFGDSSGAYPDVAPLNAAIGAAWGTMNAVPDWPETADVTPETWSIPGLYAYAGAHAPGVRFGKFDFATDEVQAFFAGLAGVDASALQTMIDGNETTLEATGIEIASFVAPGPRHTIVGEPDFYTLEVDGVRLVDWFRELIEGATPPADVG